MAERFYKAPSALRFAGAVQNCLLAGGAEDFKSVLADGHRVQHLIKGETSNNQQRTPNIQCYGTKAVRAR